MMIKIRQFKHIDTFQDKLKKRKAEPFYIIEAYYNHLNIEEIIKHYHS